MPILSLQAIYGLRIIFGVALIFVFFVFRKDKDTGPPPSRATEARFVAALVFAFVFFCGLFVRSVAVMGYIWSAGFLVWPVIALWLAAAPIAYRRPSSFLLTIVCLPSLLFWYLFFKTVGM
jgi:hypothetical protein